MTVHVLTIDSRDRDYDLYSDPASYRIMLPKKYRRVLGAKLLSAEIPCTFYVFSTAKGNTTLPLTMHGGSLVNVVLPDANYDPNTFCVVLESKLEEATGIVWTVLIDSTTMKITLKNAYSTNFAIGPWTSDKASEWGLGFYMGFEKELAYTSTNGSLTGPMPVQLNPVNYLLLDIEELNGIDEAGLHGTTVGWGSFAKIPVQVNSFDYAYLDSSKGCSPLVRYHPEVATLDRMRVRLRFHDGTLVDFRGVEHSFTLELHTRDRGDPVMNTSAALTDAASSAAAAAAAAAVTAASLQQQKRDAEKESAAARKARKVASKKFNIKTHFKWIVVGLLAVYGVYYMYKKRHSQISLPAAVPLYRTS